MDPGSCIGATIGGGDIIRYRLYGDLLHTTSKLLAYGIRK